MRISTIIFSFFFVLSGFVSGQDEKQTLLSPKVGLGLLQLNENPNGLSNKVDIGFQAGLDLRMGRRFYWQPGLFYSTNTVAMVDSSQFSLGDNSTVSKYLKFKLLGGIHLVNKEGFRLRLNAGPTVNYLLKVQSENESLALIRKEDYKSTLLNFEAGGGLDIWFLTFDVGYNFSFTKLFNFNTVDSRLVGAYIYAGIVLPL